MSDAVVLVVAEHRKSELRDVSFELVTAGCDLAESLGGDLHVALVGSDIETRCEQLNREGVAVIHTVDERDEFNHDVYTQVVEQLFVEIDPTVLLTPHSVNGMDYAPAVAESLSLPLVTDVVDFDATDGLEVIREQYGGKVEVTSRIDADNYVLTIRPSEWPQAVATGDADAVSFQADVDESRIGSTVTGYEEVVAGDVDISEASFLISIGRGIEDEANLPLIDKLVEVTGATLAASRPIVDNEWLPKNRQVGQSGRVVTPDVYLAIGISGAVQHAAGMKGSDTIVAINTDPNAPIFDIADYGIVGDLFEVVPALIEEFGGEAPDV